MNNILLNFFKVRFLPLEIFKNRNTKIRYIICQFLFVSLLLAFPLALAMHNLNYDYIVSYLFPNILEIENLQNEIINNDELIISTGNEVIIRTGDNTLINFNTSDKYLVLRDSYVEVSLNGANFYGGYTDNLPEILNNTNGNTLNLITNITWDVLHNLLSIISLIIYPIVIMLNLIFIAFISFMATFLNIDGNIKLSFKEFFALSMYSATIPVLLALAFGTFLSIAFVYLIYNFGVILFAYYVYIKAQKNYLKVLN